MHKIIVLVVALVGLCGCDRLQVVDSVVLKLGEVTCRLTWTGERTGWRLQSMRDDGSVVENGAVQKLAAFMSEPMPSKSRQFRFGERSGVKVCLADDGTCLEVGNGDTLNVYSSSGRLVTEAVSVALKDGTCVLSGGLAESEPVFGMGERLDRLNKRGQRLRLMTSDGYNDSFATYLAIPLFSTSRGGGVFVNLYDEMTADFGADEKNRWAFEIKRDAVDVYLFAKDTITDSLAAYTALSGKADVPERWNMGPVICRYHPDLTRFEGPFICKFRGMTLRGHGLKDIMERHIACGVKPSAVIIEGGNFVSALGDSNKRNELKRMAEYLESKDIRMMLYMRMGAVCDKLAPGYRNDFNVSVSIATNGVMAIADTKRIPDRYSKGINPDVGKSKAHEEADITDPEYWDWYVNVVWKGLVDLGVRGVKIDFCELMPEEGVNPGGVSVHYKWKNPAVFEGTTIHHSYPTFFISKFYREMSRLTAGKGGFMVLSRGGGIGSQRNPYLWAGDQQRLFEKLDDQVLAVLNSGMSGVPFMTYDLAGYQYHGLYEAPDGKIDGTPVGVRRSRTMDEVTEAMIFRRGVEFSAFMPCVQSHGFVRNAYDFDDATRAHYRKYMKIHDSLADYIDGLNRIAAENGVPPVRPLVFRNPEEPKTWDVYDEFLLGDALLVAPSFNKDPRKDVYLPPGDWVRVPGLDIPVYVDRQAKGAAQIPWQSWGE